MRVFVLVFLAMVSFVGRSQTITLKFNPVKGQPYTCVFETDIDQKISGQPVTMYVKAGISMTLTGTEGNIRVLEAKYNSLGIDMKMSSNTMHVDTQDPSPSADDVKADPNKIMQLMFNKLVGQIFTLSINDTGAVVKVTGFTKMVDSVAGMVVRDLSLDDSYRQTLSTSMSSQFNDESMKVMMGESFSFFPSKPVKVGDSWMKHVINDGPIAKDMETTYTVQSIAGTEVKLLAVSKINKITTASEGGDRTFTGDQTANISLDRETGMIISSVFTQNMKDEAHDHFMTTKGKVTGKLK
jgi:hypothetical protein